MGAKLTLYVQEARLLGAGDKANRHVEDFYITPDFAVRELLKRETFEGQGWEPASGNGAIAKHFSNMMASDIRKDVYGEPGVDFMNTIRHVDYIVTNPPYSLAQAFVLQALRCANKVAMLLRIQFLEGKARRVFFSQHPPVRIHIFSERITCEPDSKDGKGGMMCFAWFIWEKGNKAPPQLDWI
jgi:hypothetical protein